MNLRYLWSSGLSKEILLGPLLGGNRSKLISRCAERVAAGDSQSFLYLAASHPLLEAVTDEILTTAGTPGVWGELPVYLFRGFVRRVLTTARDEQTNTPLPPHVPIDREELPLKRSLISLILKQLAAADKLTAIKPLAHREGCVNTIATLVGEIQRAGKTPEQLQEIFSGRLRDAADADRGQSRVYLQADFDRDVALIYSTYVSLLKSHNLTESDADQLQALSILDGELDGRAVCVPWLERVELLVLDGFFDFTPVQGEMLHRLIRRIPNVVVNLNSDARNSSIFEPFRSTIDQLSGTADFEIREETYMAPTAGVLSGLRERLFTPTAEASGEAKENLPQQNVRLLTCSDRETEIRKIAKEIKRLILTEGYSLSDVALIVRERASYADTIARVMADESVACNLDRRINVSDIPSVRAARKLFDLLDAVARSEKSEVQTPELADLIKAEYFRLDDGEIAKLDEVFEQKFGSLISETNGNGTSASFDQRAFFKYSHGIGQWNPDTLENTVAFVGGSLPLSSWLERARKLVSNWSRVSETTDLVTTGTEAGSDEEIDQIEDADKVAVEDRGVEKKRRPSREVHPAAIAWAALVLSRMDELVKLVPQHGEPRDLRSALMGLLDRFQFATQIRKPTRDALAESELPHVMLDVRGLEALRRAFVVAVKSIEVTRELSASEEPPQLTLFLGELARALEVEISLGRATDRGGLRVLEATDVRGLKFRAVFIAGLVEGGFPLRAARDWIYPHEERERLKREHGLTLEDISPATLLKEEHYFYQAACRATEKLYLSRPLLLDDGAETVASYYINELERAIYPHALGNEAVRRDFDGAYVFEASTPAELATSLVRQDERHRHRAGRSGLQPLPLLGELQKLSADAGYLTTDVSKRIWIERERSSERYGPYDGQITLPLLVELLQRRFGEEYVHSASGLSTYGNCSYRFFANRLLRLEPRGEAALDLQAIDAGKLLHDVLRRFFERHRGERLDEYDRDSLRRELRDVADQVFREHESAVPPLNPDIWKIDCEIRKVILDQVLLYELTVQKQTRADVRSRYFEVAFGMTPRAAADPASRLEQLELTRATAHGDETIRIQGQIDRVDQAEDGTLVAYDYKLSTGADAEDMTSGRSLQLPIYLEALERLLLPGQTVAGGGYYILKARPGRRNLGIYRKDFGDYLGLQARNSVFSDSDWHKVREEVVNRIWEFFARMRAGDFRIRPSKGYETCRFCDYSAVCRYEKYRIRWKEERRSEIGGPRSEV